MKLSHRNVRPINKNWIIILKLPLSPFGSFKITLYKSSINPIIAKLKVMVIATKIYWFDKSTKREVVIMVAKTINIPPIVGVFFLVFKCSAGPSERIG